jgi:hypothetical protein
MDELLNERRAQIEKAAAGKTSGKAARGRPNSSLRDGRARRKDSKDVRAHIGMRFHVEPRDIPEELAARRLGLSLTEFQERLPALLQRGFPPADETTSRYCLEAIDQWRLRRFAALFSVPAIEGPKTDRETARARIRNM